MKILKRLSLGCLVLAVVAVVVLAVTAGIMLWLGPPERQPEKATRNQPVETPALPEAADPAPGEVVLPPRSLRVRLDLAEGQFRVRRGEPGEGIRIEADYDAGLYTLEQEHRAGDGGTEEVRLRFYSKYSIMRRLLTLGFENADPDNRIDIYLPPDVPLSLSGTVKMGQSDLDLTGLAVTGLDLNLEMGEHELRFEEPNPLAMDSMRLFVSKGEFRTSSLGNAGFRQADIQGSMGEVNLDLSGSYRADAVVRTRFRMGEMRVTVPRDVRVNVRPGMVFLGARNVRVREADDLPDDAPTVELHSSMSMGELTIRSR